MRTRSLLVVAALALSACRQDKSASSESALNSALSLAAQQQPASTPAISDTALTPVSSPAPAASRPTAPRPRPRPTQVAERPTPRPEPEEPAPAPAPRTGTIGAGTQVAMSSGNRVCTGSSRPGDKFVATLTSAAVGSNGAVIPAGSKAVVEVASATSGTDGTDASLLFRVRSIETPSGAVYTVSGDVTPQAELQKVRAEENSKKSDAKKVIGGAIAGAILGQMMGKDTKATVIGAAAGAAAGTVAAKATARYESCLPAGSTLTLTINDPVRVPLQ